jgi:uncharacterized protein
MTLAAPTPPAERLPWLDAVRGLAVFGILVVNAVLFLWPIQAQALGLPPTDGPLDRFARLLVAFAFEGKFFTLFSLLFGIGLAMQLDGAPSTERTVRRLLVLAGVGALHVTFAWWGDILLFYGVLGLATVAVRRWSPRQLLRGATALVLVPLLLAWAAALLTGVGAGGSPIESATTTEAVLEAVRRDHEAALTVVRSGSWPEQVVARWRDYGLAALSTTASGILALVLGLQWLGMAAWRGGWLRPEAVPRWRRLAAIAVPVALVANGAYAALVLGGEPLALDLAYARRTTAFVVGATSGCLAIGSVAAWAFVGGGRGAATLAAVGRTALSNYLFQSLVFTLIAYGLGGYGRIGWAGGLGLTIATFALQASLSLLWLARFRFGPIEAVWRAATYGRWPRWR